MAEEQNEIPEGNQPENTPQKSKVNEAEVQALISLLDDTDQEVVQQVTERLLSYGELVLPFLEDRYLSEQQATIQGKIHSIIDQIQNASLHSQLQAWAEGGGVDLFEGYFLITKFRYPELNRQTLNNLIDKIKLDAWLELSFQLSALDKIRILNRVFYDVHGFKGDSDKYHAPENSYLNKVLETHRGNPISMAMVYAIVAQRLNIPVFGVNLAQHYVLAYKDVPDLNIAGIAFQSATTLDPQGAGDVLFYINAFSKGAVFSKWNIDQFLRERGLKPQAIFYEPCSNVDTLTRVCRNLIYSYERLDDHQRVEGIKSLLDVLQPFARIL